MLGVNVQVIKTPITTLNTLIYFSKNMLVNVNKKEIGKMYLVNKKKREWIQFIIHIWDRLVLEWPDQEAADLR